MINKDTKKAAAAKVAEDAARALREIEEEKAARKLEEERKAKRNRLLAGVSLLTTVLAAVVLKLRG